jgi:hypothetical protein
MCDKLRTCSAAAVVAERYLAVIAALVVVQHWLFAAVA